MTRLHKPVRRVVDIGGVPHVVTLERSGITIRELGRRKGYGPVTYGAVRDLGAKQAAAAAAAEKAARKRQRSRGLLSAERGR